MAGDYVIRDLCAVAATTGGAVIVAGPSDEVVSFATDEPAAWSAWLQRLVEPTRRSELMAAAPTDLDEARIARLEGAGALRAADDPRRLLDERIAMMNASPAFQISSRRVCDGLLIGCTGSVVAGLMAQTLLSLSCSSFQNRLDVILTQTASRFLSRELLESYGVRCWTDAFERQSEIRVPHVTLAERAEMICVTPATADALDRIARSACSDFLSLTITASAAPVALCPAMNGRMWNNRGVQRNVETLREDGRYIIEPTVIFGAADFGPDAAPMYGGHGFLWSGPAGLMAIMSAILGHSTSRVI